MRYFLFLRIIFFRVFRIGGNEYQFDFFFTPGDFLFTFGHFFTCHLLQVGIALAHQDAFAFVKVAQQVFILLLSRDKVFETFVLFRQTNETLLVGDDFRVGNQCRNLVEASGKAFEFLKQGMMICHLNKRYNDDEK